MSSPDLTACTVTDESQQKGVVAERKALFPTLWKDTFHLHNLVTVPAARGKGVGGALMEEMIRQAHEQGAGMSLCTPTESNVSSACLTYPTSCIKLTRTETLLPATRVRDDLGARDSLHGRREGAVHRHDAGCEAAGAVDRQ